MLVAAALGCIYAAELANQTRSQEAVSTKDLLRAMNAILAFTPWALSLVKAAISSSDESFWRIARRSLPLLCLGILFSGICFTDWFYLPGQPYGEFKGAVLFQVFGLFFVVAHLVILVRAAQELRTTSGIRRVEIQFLVMSIGIGMFICGALAIATRISGVPEFRRLAKFVILAAQIFTAWGIATYRIFNVRQVALSLGHRALATIGIGLAIIGLRQFFSNFVPELTALWLSVIVAVSFSPLLDKPIQEWLQLSGEKTTAEWRAAALALVRADSSPAKLTVAFEALLRELCGAPSATLLFHRNNGHSGNVLFFSSDRPGHDELLRLGWATPESLRRRRRSQALDDLSQFLAANALGVIVAVPQGSPSPALLVAVGVKSTRWPFTYPEVRRLQSIAELMDNTLSHAHLAKQAALEAKAAHLALMSRGLAHDLKNLLTPISSFLVHTDGKFDSAGPEAEVHQAARRAVRVINDYVGETLFFSRHLQPRFGAVVVANLFAEARAQLSPLATRRQVELAVEPPDAVVLIADAALLQRMLGNIVRNAIEACSPGGRVVLRGAAAPYGFVRLEVTDNGCGIPPNNLPRVFEPHFTTKQFGDEVRGFGLGLAICEKIVQLHSGTIAVSSKSGRGTTMTVDLPSAPPVTIVDAKPRPPV